MYCLVHSVEFSLDYRRIEKLICITQHTETADTREVAIAEFDAAGQKFEQAEQEDEKLQKELKQLQNVKKFRVWEEDALSGENFKTLRSEVATAEMIAGTAKTILNTTQAIFKALHANSLPSE